MAKKFHYRRACFFDSKYPGSTADPITRSLIVQCVCLCLKMLWRGPFSGGTKCSETVPDFRTVRATVQSLTVSVDFTTHLQDEAMT